MVCYAMHWALRRAPGDGIDPAQFPFPSAGLRQTNQIEILCYGSQGLADIVGDH